MSTLGCGSCMQRAVGCTWRLGTQKCSMSMASAYAFFKVQAMRTCVKLLLLRALILSIVGHHDGVNYPCAAKIGVPWMNMEIVMVKLTGTYACGQATGTAPQLRAGWQGTKPCKCDLTIKHELCVFLTGAFPGLLWSKQKSGGVQYASPCVDVLYRYVLRTAVVGRTGRLGVAEIMIKDTLGAGTPPVSCIGVHGWL